MKKQYLYLVKDVFPTRRVHLVGGPSGVGKTTILLQWVDAWLNGEMILDRETVRPMVKIGDDAPRPAGALYLAADRCEDEFEETMERVLGENPNLTPENGFEWKAMLDTQWNINNFFENIKPYHKLVIVEGVASLVDGGRINDNATVAAFLKHANEVAKNKDIALIFTVHAPKMKRGEEYSNPRERMFGSIAWGAHSSTCVLLFRDNPEDIEDPYRTMLILPRNRKDTEYHLAADDQGRLIETAAPDTGVARVNLLAAMQPGKFYRRKEVLEIADKLNISRSSVDRFLKAFVASKQVTRDNEGRYQAPVVVTMLPASEAA